MIFNNAVRFPSRVDLCDFNDLIFQTKPIDVNGKRYLVNPASKPLSYAELRSMMTDRAPSPVMILPKPNLSSRTSKDSERASRRKTETKRTGVDVYRTLVRNETHSLNSFERDSFTDSFIIDRLSPSSLKNVSRSRSLPKLPKQTVRTQRHFHELSHSSMKKSYRLSPSILTKPLVPIPRSSPMMRHLTTPVDSSDQLSETDITTVPSVISTTVSENFPHKRLHIYIP